MFKLKRKKITAFALSAFIAVGILGTTVASAHPHDNPPPPHHHYHRHWVDGHWNYDHHWVRGHWENR